MGSLYGQPIWRGYMDSSYAPWIWTVAKAKASPAAGSQGQAIKAEPAEDRHKANAAPVRAPAAEACPFISKPMLCWVACLPDGTPCQPFIAGGLVSKAGPAPSTPQATASPRTPPSSGGGLSIYIYIYMYINISAHPQSGWIICMDSLYWQFILTIQINCLYGQFILTAFTESLYGQFIWTMYMESEFGEFIWRLHGQLILTVYKDSLYGEFIVTASIGSFNEQSMWKVYMETFIWKV